MDTKLLDSGINNLEYCAQLLKRGEVVAIPTETVYGLAANALNEAAVKKIFLAKGRPQDNPLIVHISDMSMIGDLVENVPDLAYKLANKFWPGPLTMVMKKSELIPNVTSGGLDTVGIRMPSHKVAREIIGLCGFPLAAPSANLSGKPSPTTALDVYEDMNGRIPLIIDGGESKVGVESTVISFENNGVRLLRPGFVSVEDLLTVTSEVYVDKGVLESVSSEEKVMSPGMKYKHYSPNASVIILESSFDDFCKYVSENCDDNTYALVFDSEVGKINIPHLTYGDTSEEQANQLFTSLRKLDRLNASKVYVRCPEKDGVGLAVFNRLIRAAGFNIIKL